MKNSDLAPSIKIKLRSSAVAARGSQVLIHQYKGSAYWSLPGGKIEAGEDSRDALVREIKEESGLHAQAIRLLWVIENFYQQTAQRSIHEIAFYYLVEIDRQGEQPFMGTERDLPLYFRWVEASDLQSIELVPAMLKNLLAHLPASPAHYIFREGE